jgi:uncharacterized protein (TIGR03066 family)
MATHPLHPGRLRDRNRSARKSKPTAPDRRPRAVSAGNRSDQQAPPRGRWLPQWAAALLAVALAAGGTFALCEFALLARLPAEVVGEWRVVGGELDGATFEFRRDGTMVGRFLMQGQEGLIEGKAEGSGKALRTTTTNPFTRKAETGTQTIVTLTETEFVTEDGKGTRVTMTRVR